MEIKKFSIVIEMIDGRIIRNELQAPIDYLIGFTKGKDSREHFKNLQEIKRIHILEIES